MPTAPRIVDGMSALEVTSILNNLLEQSTQASQGPSFPTLAAAAATSFEASVPAALVLGYTVAGDGGGALYARVGSEPAHAGKFQSADGAWWEIAEAAVSPEMLGGTDSTAFQAAVTTAKAIGAMLVGRPGATYTLATTIDCTGGGIILRGNGASISYTGTGSTAVLDFGDGSAGVQAAVEVSGWTVSMSLVSHVFVYGRRFRGLLIEKNSILKGQLVETWLSAASAGLTGASWDSAQPDITAITETDLSQDIVVRGNTCVGTGTTPDGSQNRAVIRVHWATRILVEGNTIRDYGVIDSSPLCSGVVWWGGDSAVDKDGGQGSVRWARDIRIIGNFVDGVSSGGIWGSQGENIAVTGNTVKNCGDICIHGEGDRNATYSGNAAENGRGGEYAPFFAQENVVYSGNSARKTDMATYGYFQFRWNNALQKAGLSVTVVGNTFMMEDTTSTRFGEINVQAGGQFIFRGNTCLNVRYNGLSGVSNASKRVIEGNVFTFTEPLETSDEWYALVTGPHNAETGTYEGGCHVNDNRIDASAISGDIGAGGIGLAIYSAGGATGNPKNFVERNWVSGFVCSIMTQSQNTSGLHWTRIANNWTSGIICDRTNRELVTADVNRPVLIDNYRIGDDLASHISHFDNALPTYGVWTEGSRGLYNAPAAAGYEGFISMTAPIAGAYSAVWSGGGTFFRWDHVKDSVTNRVFIALADGGESVNPEVDKTDQTKWRPVAGNVVTFKGRGLIET